MWVKSKDLMYGELTGFLVGFFGMITDCFLLPVEYLPFKGLLSVCKVVKTEFIAFLS